MGNLPKFYKKAHVFIVKMKCSICGKKIEEIFLKKVIGTYIKDKKGKKHIVCANCQKELGGKEKILSKL